VDGLFFSEAFMTANLTCRVCGKPITRRHSIGRPPVTCSEQCRMRRKHDHQTTFQERLKASEDRFERLMQRLERMLERHSALTSEQEEPW
jgi:predicted nucleic acid-binding Zn ribbon protein